MDLALSLDFGRTDVAVDRHISSGNDRGILDEFGVDAALRDDLCLLSHDALLDRHISFGLDVSRVFDALQNDHIPGRFHAETTED